MEPKEQADSNIRNKEDLLEIFHESMKPSSEFRIGAEAEKFGVFRESKKPIQYEDASSSGIVNILHELSEKFGWVKDLEHERSPLIALKRGMGSITLEPGAQLELSGAPHENLHDVNFEMNIHLDELEQISKPLGIEWLGVGFHPFSKIEELSWVPKPRYGIMKTYLPTRGIQGLNMMLRTSTVQANFDYSSEEFAMRCLNVGLRLSPLVTAIFANSPFVEGKRWGGKSYRAKVWLDVDGSRQGLLPELMVKGKKFSDYVEWALDAPMFLIKRGDQIIENTNQTFREFLKVGKGGLKATQSDWQMHINSMFPEVRLKRTIEMRCADSLPMPLAMSLPALWTGILYDESALSEAEDFCHGFKPTQLQNLRTQIPLHGLSCLFQGRQLIEDAIEIIQIAKSGLERRSKKNLNGQDETLYLDPIVKLIEHGKCPADALLEDLTHENSSIEDEILRRTLIRSV